MANQQEQVHQQVWFILQELNNLRLLAPGQEVLFDIRDGEAVSPDQQRLILESLASRKIIRLNPIFPSGYASNITTMFDVAAGKQIRYYQYYVSFTHDFATEYQEVEKLNLEQLKTPVAEGEVTFTTRNNTVRQGPIFHQIVSADVRRLVAYLWAKRTQVDKKGAVIKEGSTVGKGAVKVDLTLNTAQIKSIVTMFNEQMRAKGINAKIKTTKDTVVMIAEGDV